MEEYQCVAFSFNFAFDIAEHPNVVSVLLNRGRKLHTTHSWEFMSLEHNGVAPSHSLLRKARYGEDVIIGNLDTGKILSFFFFLYLPLLSFNYIIMTLLFCTHILRQISKIK